MPVIETLILIGGMILYSGTVIYDQHNQLVELKKNCPNEIVQTLEKK